MFFFAFDSVCYGYTYVVLYFIVVLLVCCVVLIVVLYICVCKYSVVSLCPLYCCPPA